MAPILPGPPPIQGGTTAVTVFVGHARTGALHAPTAIRTVAEYEETFGGLDPLSEMSYAVRQFFANGGTDAIIIAADRAGGSAAIRAGIAVLDTAPPFNLLCVPGAGDPLTIAAAAECCEARRAFLIADPPSAAATTPEVLLFVAQEGVPKSTNAAFYYPWLNIANPAAGGAPRLSAPSGTIAGLYARNDAERGVWSVPAGTSLQLKGVISLARELDDEDSGLLNPRAINAIRVFQRFGPVVWGARTVAGDELRESDWKYVSVRRLALYIENSICQSLSWAAFEPNDAALWASIRDTINVFMIELWEQGAFLGSRPGDGFFVVCDETVTTPDDVMAGFLNIMVGFVPVQAGEFVTLQLQLAAAAPV